MDSTMESTMENSAMEPVDIIIIGGSFAGLSAAVTIARSCRSTIVFDSGECRLSENGRIHFLPPLDRVRGMAFREAARKNILDNYQTVEFKNLKVIKVFKTTQKIFEVTDQNGDIWLSKSLLLATGVEEIMPKLDGYAECWNSQRLLHCLLCGAYEKRDAQSCGVLTIDSCDVLFVLHTARRALQFAKEVTIYMNGNPAKAKELESSIKLNQPMKVDDRKLQCLVTDPHKDGVVVCFRDGFRMYHPYLVHQPLTKPRGDLVQQLSLMTDSVGTPTVDMFGASSVPGVFVASDVLCSFKVIPTAMASGTMTGFGLTSYAEAAY